MMYSQGLRLFYNRGLHLLVTKTPQIPRVVVAAQSFRSFSIFSQEQVSSSLFVFKLMQRDFSTGGKKKKGKGQHGTASDAETATAETPASEERRGAVQHEELHLDRSLFQPFTLGDVKKIQSTPDHQVSHSV
jgi:hypothetical protein